MCLPLPCFLLAYFLPSHFLLPGPCFLQWVDAKGKSSSLYGVSLLLFAVCCDAVSPVVQERLLGRHAVSAAELMVRTNLIAFVGLAASWLTSREFEGYDALPPLDSFWFPLMLCTYGATSYVGVTFMLALIEVWGSAAGVAVGTLRKVVTIVISFLWWSKPFSATFALSGLAVLASIAINALAKRLEAACSPHAPGSSSV